MSTIRLLCLLDVVLREAVRDLHLLALTDRVVLLTRSIGSHLMRDLSLSYVLEFTLRKLLLQLNHRIGLVLLALSLLVLRATSAMSHDVGGLLADDHLGLLHLRQANDDLVGFLSALDEVTGLHLALSLLCLVVGESLRLGCGKSHMSLHALGYLSNLRSGGGLVRLLKWSGGVVGEGVLLSTLRRGELHEVSLVGLSLDVGRLGSLGTVLRQHLLVALDEVLAIAQVHH